MDKIIRKPIEIIGMGSLLILCTVVGIIRLLFFPIKMLGKIRQKKPKVSRKLVGDVIGDPKKDVLSSVPELAYNAFGWRAKTYALVALRSNGRYGAIRARIFGLLADYTLITLS